MASIVKRGKKYSVVFYEGEGKERHQVWESGLSYTQAKARKAKIELDQLEGTHIDQNNILFKPFMMEFIEKHGTVKWGESYYNSSIGLLNNYIYPYWEDKLIRKITVKDVDDYYHYLTHKCERVYDSRYQKGKKEKGTEHVTESVVNDIHKLLRCAFNKAKKWQYIRKNPFLDAELPEYKMKERPALTPTQLDQIFDATDNPEDYDLYLIHCAMNLAFAGSMRGGEIGGLQWDDIIDHDRRVLYVHKTIDRVSKEALKKVSKTQIYFKFPCLFPNTKSIIVLKNTKEDGGSDRKCFLPEVVYNKLMVLKSLQDNMKQDFGEEGYVDYGLIICQANGRPIMTEHLNHRFQAVLDDLGIKPPAESGEDKYVFHSIRSSATTYKLRISGGDIKAVQGENGQKDPKMVTHQYSRILDEDRQRIASTMNEDFYSKSNTKSDASSEALITMLQQNPELANQLLTMLTPNKTANTK